MKITNSQRGKILCSALPYIKKYNKEIIVIKYGGNAMINEELKQKVMSDIILLNLIGLKVVLVHGGGPEITEMLTKLGKKAEFVNGLRVTDEETAKVAQMVLAGKVNKSLASLIESNGGKAVGISGIDGNMIEAVSADSQLGFVGEITKIDVSPITKLLDQGYIPVIASIGSDKDGNVYNINADAGAAKIAVALKAKSLFLMTDVAGILSDKDDVSTLIPVITPNKALRYIKEGVIGGGMIPKVNCCIEAIKEGVKRVFIIDGRVEHSILIEILTDDGMGTMFIGG